MSLTLSGGSKPSFCALSHLSSLEIPVMRMQDKSWCYLPWLFLLRLLTWVPLERWHDNRFVYYTPYDPNLGLCHKVILFWCDSKCRMGHRCRALAHVLISLVPELRKIAKLSEVSQSKIDLAQEMTQASHLSFRTNKLGEGNLKNYKENKRHQFKLYKKQNTADSQDW